MQDEVPDIYRAGSQDGRRDGHCRPPGAGLQFLTPDPKFWCTPSFRAQADRLCALVRDGPAQNVALIGPHGSGKTCAARQIAAHRGGPAAIINCYQAESSREWFGERELVEGRGTVYRPALLVEAIETRGATVILNDLLRMQSRSSQNGLFNILDDSLRQEWIEPLGRIVHVAEGVLIIATWNDGIQYTGNIRQDEALVDRFATKIYFDYPAPDVSQEILVAKTGVSPWDARRLVRYATRLRGASEPVAVSMRALLAAAAMLAASASLFDAVNYTIVGGLPRDQQEAALAALDAVLTIPEKERLARRDEEGWSTW